MTDESIERPKGRRNNSIDLTSRNEEPVHVNRKSISFGSKKNPEVQQESETTETSARQPFTFTRRTEKKTNEKAPEPIVDKQESVEPIKQTQGTPETQKPRSVSIDLGNPSTGSARRSVDLGSVQSQKQSAQNMSLNLDSQRTRTQSQESIDLGTGTPVPKTDVENNPSQSDSTVQQKPARKKSVLGGAGAIIPFGKEEKEDRKGTWGDSGYRATDDQAHRDRTYHIPSFIKQTMIVFMVQMRLFSKMKWTYFMLFVALLIPIVFFAARDLLSMMMTAYGFMTEYSNTFIAGMLAFLPLLLGLFTSVLCGTQLPNEFKERTAYMNVSLPMSRTSFYLGKYLAGFVLSLAVFMFAYGMAIATSMSEYDAIFADLLSSSLALTIVAVFSYSATAFCIGSFMRRGSSLIPFILMSVALPLTCALIFAYYMETGPDLSGLFYLPCFLGETALGILGAPMSGSVGMIIMPYIDMTSIGTNIAVGVVWGVAFLILGMLKTIRREM